MEVHATFQEAVDAIVDGALSPGGDLRAGHGNPEVAAELVQTMCDNYLRQEREHGREGYYYEIYDSVVYGYQPG